MTTSPPCHSDPLILDCYPAYGVDPTPEHLEQLDAIAARVAASYFTKSPVTFITIDGFAVRWQPSDNTAQMAERRAKHVQEALSSRLRARGLVVENLRVLVRGMDTANPRVSDATEHGRALNRRVEILLAAPKGFVYAARETPLQVVLQRLRIRFSPYTFAPARPDDPAVNLTGVHAVRYTPSSSGYAGSRIAVQINQAGRYLKIWYTRYQEENAKQRTGKTVPMTRVLHGSGAGTLKGTSGDEVRFTYSVGGDEGFSGTIVANRLHGGVGFEMVSGKWKRAFERQSRTPRISDRAIAAFPDAHLKTEARSAQEHPFLEAEFRDIVSHFLFGSSPGIGSKDSLLGLIRQYVEGRASPFVPAKKAVAIEQRFMEQIVARIPLVQLQLVDHWMRNVLGGVSPDAKRSYWEWLHLICTEHHAHMPSLVNWTRCASRLSRRTFGYEWSFVGLGAGADAGFFGGKYYRGHITIALTRPAKAKWKKRYPAYVGGFGAGLSAGAEGGLKLAEGTLESRYEWDQKNFVGDFRLYEGSLLSVNVPTGEYSVDKTTVTFRGDKHLPPLSGVAENTMATGLGAGSGSSVLVGEIYATGDELEKEFKRIVATAKKVKIQSDYGASDKLHFAVDATTLTPAGRQMLREMLATHLAIFMNPGSTLQIDGHASPSGPAKHNEELSWVRAVNVLQAIDDILGTDFRIKPEHVTVHGWGEEKSAKALGDRDIESAEWRRVDITLDGKLALTLKAPA